MRQLSIVFAILLCVMHAAAQDLIVTDKGDSINCLITREKPDYIYFTYREGSEVRNTLLPRGRIKFYQENFYGEAEVPPAAIPQQHRGGWFAIRAGWGHRTASLPADAPSDVKGYLKKLKNGFNIYADAGFSVSKSLGFGLTYAAFTSNNQAASLHINGGSVSTSDKIWIHYIGPSTLSRFGNNDNVHFTNSFSLGLLAYHDDATVSSTQFEISGQTIGFAADLGVEIDIDDKKSFLMSLSLIAGSLSKLKITSGAQSTTQKLDNENRENLTRINLSAGLRFGR